MPCLPKKDVDILRELLFTMYDIEACMAGGKETGKLAEIALFMDLTDKACKKSLIHPATCDKQLNEKFKNAAIENNGQVAHFYSRMMFGDVIYRLQNAATCEL